MSKNNNAVTDGTFTLMEGEEKNQFYFFRNDKSELGDVGRAPMDLYQTYIAYKMMEGDISEVIMNNVCYEYADDGKTIRLTTTPIGVGDSIQKMEVRRGQMVPQEVPKEKGGIFKRIKDLIHKAFV